MCLAIPAKVVATDGEMLVVDFGVAKRRVKNLAGAKINEWVIVKGKIAIEKVEEEAAREMLQGLEVVQKKKKKKSAK